MINTLKKIASSFIREHFTKPKERSSEWPTVRKHHLKNHPTCAACGSKMLLQVHHIHPFHLDPSLELDPNNLITLCMSLNKCHLELGHGDDFKAINPKLTEEIVEILAENPYTGVAMLICKAEAKKVRVYTNADQE